MKALFNRNHNGSEEIKSLLGFLDADIDYSKLKQEIAYSTKEVIKLIGKAIYDKTHNDYIKEEDNDLIELIQYPIALDAYRKYAPNNDVGHTNNGRLMRLGEHEKQAFEWLIDRDNEAMERKYYRSLDHLIDYLYENEKDWHDTDSFKQLTNSVFKTTDEFDDIFPIQSRLLLLKLQPGIRKCLDFEIKPRLSKSDFEAFITNKADSQLSFSIKSALVYYSLAWAMPRLSVSLFPEGILQGYVSDKTTSKARKPTVKNELAYAKENFENDYKSYLLKIEKLVKPILLDQEINLNFNSTPSKSKFLST